MKKSSAACNQAAFRTKEKGRSNEDRPFFFVMSEQVPILGRNVCWTPNVSTIADADYNVAVIRVAQKLALQGHTAADNNCTVHI